MVLKYINKGWVVIGGIEEVEIITKSSRDILGEDFSKDDFDELIPQIQKEVGELENVHFSNWRFALSERSLEEATKGTNVYFKVIIYEKEINKRMVKTALVVSDECYLMNDNGSTVEKIKERLEVR